MEYILAWIVIALLTMQWAFTMTPPPKDNVAYALLLLTSLVIWPLVFIVNVIRTVKEKR